MKKLYLAKKLKSSIRLVNCSKNRCRFCQYSQYLFMVLQYLFAYNMSNFLKAFWAIIPYSSPKSQKRITQR